MSNIIKSISVTDTSGNDVLTVKSESDMNESIFTDSNGFEHSVDVIVLNGVVITKDPEVYGFYHLNKVYDSILGTWIAPSKEQQTKFEPSRWFNTGKKNQELHRFFAAQVGYSPIEYSPVGTQLISDAETPIKLPDYKYVKPDILDSCIKSDHSSLGRSGHKVNKPYPIHLINGGPKRGTWGPILTLLKYASWINPYLEVDIYDQYTSKFTISGRVNDIWTNVDSSIIRDKFMLGEGDIPHGYLTMQGFAKHLRALTGRDIGRNRIFSMLRGLDILGDGENFELNQPTPDVLNAGWFTTITVLDDNNTSRDVTLITPSGVSALGTKILMHYMGLYSK